MENKKAIIVDIHSTLLNKENKLDKNLCDMFECLKQEYYILLVTAHSYKSQKEFLKDIFHVKNIGDGLYYNHNLNYKKDDEIKQLIYESQIKLSYNVIAVIDNNKSVIKMFKKLGIDTMRFKQNNG